MTSEDWKDLSDMVARSIGTLKASDGTTIAIVFNAHAFASELKMRSESAITGIPSIVVPAS